MRDDYLPLILLDEIDYYVSVASCYVPFAKSASACDSSVCDVWYDPSGNRLVIRTLSGSVKTAGNNVAHLDAFTSLPDPYWCALSLSPISEPKGGYFSVARDQIRDQLDDEKIAEMRKQAEKPVTLSDKLLSIAGWNDRYYPTSPIAAMLASGVLGAGIGYGGASLASLFLPNDWDKKKFRRSGLLLGGAVGAAPGAYESLKSVAINQPLLSGSHMHLKKESEFPAGYVPAQPYGRGPTMSGDDLIKAVWQQPGVKNNLSPAERSIFTGAVTSTQQIAGSPFITPSDMGRLTAGMGVGYASGLVAGKVLGQLVGLPPSAQKTLANTGMYAGVVKSVLPILFGVR
jgi:hypothetical protein